MVRRSAVLAFTSALMILACAEEEQEPGIDTARSETKPLVDAACDWMFGCCSPDELVYQVGDFTVDANDCSVRLLDAIATGVPLGLQDDLSDDSAEALLVLALSINEGRVEINGSAVSVCADATSMKACNMVTEFDPDERCTPGSEAVPDPCDPSEMFTGKQGVGEACDGPWECKTGLRCVDFGLAGVCASRAPLGGNCFTDGECATDLICDYQTGSCATGAALGQTCAFSDPLNPLPGTESIRCEPGLSCDPMGLTCAGGFCSPGSSCNDIFNDTDCPETYYCVGNFATPSTCQMPGDVGAPCTKGMDCVSGACDQLNEVCTTLLGDGSPCFGHDECESAYCDGIMCSPTAGPGQACMSFNDAECEGGFCDTSDPVVPVCQTYAGEGGACPNGNECDPQAALSCVDMSCLQEPFPDGTTCFNPIQCESAVCFNGACSPGTALGAACATDGSTEPCVLGSSCEAPAGVVDGTCSELRRSGQACESSNQCWGNCVMRFGSMMCDATPALALDEMWCDGS